MRRLVNVLAVSFVVLGGLLSGVAGASARPAVASAPLPTVHGSYANVPTVSFPAVAAPKTLQAKVLSRGSGATVTSHDVVVVNYLGQLWRGKVFDSSFSRHQLFAFIIDDQQVITGWDQGLTGVRVGSRVLLVIPPKLGYGATAQGSIPANSTLTFVVDVVASYAKNAGGDAHATNLSSSANGISVSGRLGQRPAVTVAKSAPRPSKLTATVLARGHGPKLQAGFAIVEYVAIDWTGKSVATTWGTNPIATQVGQAGSPSSFDPLVGDPVGSRVLIEIPSSSQGGPYAVVADILGPPNDPQKG